MSSPVDPSPEFRAVRAADLPVVRAWLEGCAGTGLSLPPGTGWESALLGATSREAWLACGAAGALLGFLRLEFVGEAAEVTVLVAPDHRHAGIGRRLLAQAERRAAARGARLLLAHLQHDNAAAHRLFVRAGYRPVASRLSGVHCFERAVAAQRGAVPLVIDP